MSEDLGEGIAMSVQKLLPFLSAALILFISYVPVDSSLINNVRPAVVTICSYFWLMHRPDVFNLWSVYFLALIDDIISSAPMGSSVLSALILYVLVTNLHKYFNAKPFVVIWYGFVAVSLVVFLLRWFVVSVYYGQFLPFVPLLFTYFATIAFYPIISMFNAFIQNNFMKEEA